MKTLIRLGVATCLLASGCVSAREDEGAPEELAPISAFADAPSVARERWEAAPASCEGIEGASWRAAEGAPPLVVVTARDGSVLCVDTFEALIADLPAYPSYLESCKAPSPSEDPEPQPALQP